MRRFFMALGLSVLGALSMCLSFIFWIDAIWTPYDQDNPHLFEVWFLVSVVVTIYAFFTMITKKGFIPKIFKWLFSFIPFKIVQKGDE